MGGDIENSCLQVKLERFYAKTVSFKAKTAQFGPKLSCFRVDLLITETGSHRLAKEYAFSVCGLLQVCVKSR
jgi:hypothetical protein